MKSPKSKIQNPKIINGGLPRRLAPPTRGRRPREEVRALWGQSLFEVIFALALAGIIMLGVVSLAASSVRNSSFSRNKTLATRYAQEAVEWLREERDTDWVDFRNNHSSGSGSTWCLDSSPLSTWGSSGGCGGTEISGTIFVREATLTETSSPPNPVIILAEVTVVWDDAQGTHEVSTETQFTPWGGT